MSRPDGLLVLARDAVGADEHRLSRGERLRLLESDGVHSSLLEIAHDALIVDESADGVHFPELGGKLQRLVHGVLHALAKPRVPRNGDFHFFFPLSLGSTYSSHAFLVATMPSYTFSVAFSYASGSRVP